jgi:hypothetical protein
MRIFTIVITVLLFSLPLLAQTKSTTKTLSITEREVDRDFSLEKAAVDRTGKLKGLLEPEARVKLDFITLEMLALVVTGSETDDYNSLARQRVRGKFDRLSTSQFDLFSFYVLAEVCRILRHPENLRNMMVGLGLDGMDGMSEMTSLRLQMTLDRRSKFISTLSQVMRSISTTQDTLIRNIK